VSCLHVVFIPQSMVSAVTGHTADETGWGQTNGVLPSVDCGEYSESSGQSSQSMLHVAGP
jgi:hypothetical protein